jgi:hypothetical protein
MIILTLQTLFNMGYLRVKTASFYLFQLHTFPSILSATPYITLPKLVQPQNEQNNSTEQPSGTSDPLLPH